MKGPFELAMESHYLAVGIVFLFLFGCICGALTLKGCQHVEQHGVPFLKIEYRKTEP